MKKKCCQEAQNNADFCAWGAHLKNVGYPPSFENWSKIFPNKHIFKLWSVFFDFVRKNANVGKKVILRILDSSPKMTFSTFLNKLCQDRCERGFGARTFLWHRWKAFDPYFNFSLKVRVHPKYLYTSGTLNIYPQISENSRKNKKFKNLNFLRVLYGWYVHIMLLWGAHNSKVCNLVPTPCCTLKSDKNSSLWLNLSFQSMRSF